MTRPGSHMVRPPRQALSSADPYPPDVCGIASPFTTAHNQILTSLRRSSSPTSPDVSSSSVTHLNYVRPRLRAKKRRSHFPPEALLYQSILLILSQLALLSLCLHFKPRNDDVSTVSQGSVGGRIRTIWRWDSLGSYLEFLAGLILALLVLQLVLGRQAWYYES